MHDNFGGHIGFGPTNYPPDRCVGWCKGSMGLHADDECIFINADYKATKTLEKGTVIFQTGFWFFFFLRRFFCFVMFSTFFFVCIFPFFFCFLIFFSAELCWISDNQPTYTWFYATHVNVQRQKKKK